MSAMYYRGAQAAVLVYDVTQPDTLESMHSWTMELMQRIGEGEILLFVAGNKADLRGGGAGITPSPVGSVDKDAGRRYAESIRM
jgi:Ras-related protein Rab-5C